MLRAFISLFCLIFYLASPAARAAVDVDLAGTVLTVAFDDAEQDALTLEVTPTGYQTMGAQVVSGTGTITKVVVSAAGTAHESEITFAEMSQDLPGGLEVGSNLFSAVIAAPISTDGGDVSIDAALILLAADIDSGSGSQHYNSYGGEVRLVADAALTADTTFSSIQTEIRFDGIITSPDHFDLLIAAEAIVANHPIGGENQYGQLGNLKAITQGSTTATAQTFNGVVTIGMQRYLVGPDSGAILLNGAFDSTDGEIRIYGEEGQFGTTVAFGETFSAGSTPLSVENITFAFTSSESDSECEFSSLTADLAERDSEGIAYSGSGVRAAFSLRNCSSTEELSMSLDLGAIPFIGSEVFTTDGSTLGDRVEQATRAGSVINFDIADNLELLDDDSRSGYVASSITLAIPATVSSSGPQFTLALPQDAVGTVSPAEDYVYYPSFGGAIAKAGDINGDGQPDVIIGDSRGRYSPQSPYRTGMGYVLFGDTLDRAIDVPYRVSADDSPEQGFQIKGDDDTNLFGSAVDGARDLNGDGYDDLLIGSPGADYARDNGLAAILLGPHVGDTHQYSLIKITGGDTDALLGSDVAFLGDINNDGWEDFAVSAPGTSNIPSRVHVIFGSINLTGTTTINVNDLGDSKVTFFSGGAAGDYWWTGFSLGAGDINGDGINDIVVASYSALTSDSWTDNGRVSVIYGKSEGWTDLNLGLDLGDAGFHIDGGPNMNLGARVAVTDVNGDGMSDIAIAAKSSAYVVFGATSVSENLNVLRLGDRGFTIGATQEVVADPYLYSVADVGDINHDGLSDIFVGVPYRQTDGVAKSGLGVVFYGSETTANQLSNVTIDNPGDRGFWIQSSVSNGELGGAAAGVGDMSADGRDDFYIRGSGLYLIAGFEQPSLAYDAPVTELVGNAISLPPITVSNGSESFSVAPTLPSGLTLDAATGLISGIPQVAGSGNYVVSMVDRMEEAYGPVSFTLALEILAVLPGAPTAVMAQARDSSAIVSWTAPNSDGGLPITLYRATATPGGAFCEAAQTSCVIGGLVNGTSYTVTVVAITDKGASENSAPSGAFSWVDDDADGIANSLDNCPTDANPDQLNTDSDTQGNVCDSDDDNDGLTDAEELALGTDPLDTDSDDDGWSDKEEIDEGTDPLRADSQPEVASGLPIWLLYQAAQ